MAWHMQLVLLILALAITLRAIGFIQPSFLRNKIFPFFVRNRHVTGVISFLVALTLFYWTWKDAGLFLTVSGMLVAGFTFGAVMMLTGGIKPLTDFYARKSDSFLRAGLAIAIVLLSLFLYGILTGW